MSDIFKTITGPSEAKYTEKMSKFLAFAFPVKSAAEARERIAAVANKYHDARHVCWAYMIGPDRTESLSTDNGEPSGTAGKPILGQLLSHNLTDCLIVVVRYFGGTKLGVSGLIQAYRESAQEVIAASKIVEKTVDTTVCVEFSYVIMNDVMRVVKEEMPRIEEQQFDNLCSMKLSIRQSRAQRLIDRLQKIEGATTEIV